MDLQWSRRGLGPASGDQWRGAETLPGPRALKVLISSLLSAKPHIAFPARPRPPPASLFTSGFRLQTFSRAPRNVYVFMEPCLCLEWVRGGGNREPQDVVCLQCACNLSGSSRTVVTGRSIHSFGEE